jgi:hypothetical protein
MNLNGMRELLDRDHADILGDARYSVEGLDRAACPPLRKYLAQLAAGACCRGLTAEEWRAWVRADAKGMDADDTDALLGSTEDCMHQAGLWPWPGR